MGERADEIKRQVEEARARLGQDLNELEYRVRSQFDWRLQFRRYPWAFVGAAFALAAAVGMLTKKSRSQQRREAVERAWMEREPVSVSRPWAEIRRAFRAVRERESMAAPQSKGPAFR